MVNEITYYDSNYNYINPVRHFKANDPYYYEVDNIPIKQLEESKNFLKDQVDGILRDRANFKISVSRNEINELQPFATGSDRKVRVKPGRYTARVNDAYSITPLQFITQVAGFTNTTEDNTTSPVRTYQVQKRAGTDVAAALDIFQSGLTGAALNMNGLAERSFTFPIYNEEAAINNTGGAEFLNATSIAEYLSERNVVPATGPFKGGEQGAPTLPNIIGDLFAGGFLTDESMQAIRNVYQAGTNPDASQQGRLESSFIKRWRGAIRTAVVDVSGELSVTVPDFVEDDFFYMDSDGTKQQLAATQRIDLVFIYSKAVDQDETTLAQRDAGGTNRVIRKPALGILKGAGMGISRMSPDPNRYPEGYDSTTELTSLDGTPIMLAHPGDEGSTSNGFETSTTGVIRGSFPAPDDLLNLAPVLSENLESNSIALIGQSILPVAYIRVTNSGGIADIVEENDIIDIRPFFRTTELAYNERAGIAAATPQISIANPVVSEASLDKTRREVFGTLNDRINNLQIPPEAPSRIVGMGTVCGGMRYGPEGALFRQAAPNILGRSLANVEWSELADAAEEFFNYIPGSITFDTAWDPAPWALNKSPDPGRRGADAIHVCWPMIAESTNPHKYDTPPFRYSVGMGSNNTIAKVANHRSGDNFAGMASFGAKRPHYDEIAGLPNVVNVHLGQNVVIHYCRKIIKINRDNVPWMSDYTVNAQLINCIPLSARGNSGSKRQGHAAGASNIWINKLRDYFVINVAWVANDFNRIHQGQNYNRIDGRGIPWANRNDLEELAAFALPEIPITDPGNFQQYPVQSRQMPGVISNQGGRILSQVNKNLAAGSGLSNKNTNINYFTDVTPVLYPTVQYEIVGHSNLMIQKSPKGNSLVYGRTPTIELI